MRLSERHTIQLKSITTRESEGLDLFRYGNSFRAQILPPQIQRAVEATGVGSPDRGRGIRAAA